MNGLDDLAPRAYQTEIFERAREENVVCAMDTGSGKTLIAVLLIKWMAAKPENANKKIVFIVPKVPLVEQQTNVVKDQTPLRVKGYYGQMGVDAWDKSAWQTEFEKNDVLVMTAQIFYDVLLHAYWSLKEVSLVIFDEAHHCQKKHPYAKIMSDHYRLTESAHQPKILGLTASPIWNVKDPRKAIWNLEQAMNAKVIAVAANTSELEDHRPKPTERLDLYPRAPLEYPTYPYPTVWQECKHIFEHLLPFKEYNQRVGKYSNLLEATGPWGADRWTFGELETLLRQKQSGYEAALSELARRGGVSSGGPGNETTSSETSIANGGHEDSYLESARLILDAHRPRFADDLVAEDAWLSPKLRRLVELLNHAYDRRTDVFRCIIFTQQRSVASTLSWILSRIPCVKDWVKPDVVMGHGSGGYRASKIGDGMMAKLQREVIARFRTGEVNLLVATNVAEEGLDFKACHIIVRFDPLQTFVGYVQSRGRARRVDSEYIVMIAEDAQSERILYETYKTLEPSLKKRYQEGHGQPPDNEDEDDDNIEDEQNQSEMYIIPSTGAKLTSYAAIPLIVYLCTLIPHDGFSPTHQPRWETTSTGEGHYQCTMTLPSAFPLEGAERVFVGPVRRGKRSAKSSVAFAAMRKLIELEVFDAHLLPGQLERGDSALDADDRGIVPISHLKPVITVDSHDPLGSFTASDTTTDDWLHPIFVDGRATTGLLTAAKLQVSVDADFPLIGPATKRIRIGEAVPLSWGDDDGRKAGHQLLDEFFVRMLDYATGGKPLEPGVAPYYLVPLNAEGEIAWDVVLAVVEPLPRVKPQLDLSSDALQPGQIVQQWGIIGRLYRVIGVRPDITIMSPPQEEALVKKGYASYADYWQAKGRALVPSDEPFVELLWLKKHQAISTTLSRISDLAEHLPNKDMKEQTAFVPISLCVPVPVPFDIFEVFRTLPSIIRHIIDLHRSTLIQADIPLPPVHFQRVIEALTIPASGSVYSFQRLETLGDAVLKNIVAVHIYNKFPFRHEGQLDIARSNSVNNTYLLGRAVEVGLGAYLIHELVRPRWRPKLQVRKVGGGGKGSGEKWMSIDNEIARKTLPDVMEALLGVSYLRGGIETALRTGTALGLCTGGISPWPDRQYETKGDDAGDAHSALLRPLEAKLQYQFHGSKLLLQALCHPTFAHEDVPSYQRLEFLGDAIIDLYVTQYLFLKYPEATPGQITWAKARSVCNPVLGTLSLRSLELHKFMLANSISLDSAISQYIETIQDVPYSRLVVETWAFDPPKPLCDLLEAVIGAVFVDSNYDVDTVFRVLMPIMKDVLDVVSPKMPRDPTTELMIWAQRAESCGKIKYEKSSSNPDAERPPIDCMTVVIHGHRVTPPVREHTLSLSKYAASTLALATIKDETSEFYLPKICDCRAVREAELAEKKAAARLKRKGPDAMDVDGDEDEDVGDLAAPSAIPSSAPGAVEASSASPRDTALPTPTRTSSMDDDDQSGPEEAKRKEAVELEARQEMLVYESLMKQTGEGDASRFDGTELGWELRAKTARKLFDDPDDEPRVESADGGLADEEDEDEDA